AYEGALALAEGCLVSRTHFARFLVQSGIVEDERKVFKRFLVSGKPGHVPGEWASLEEAVGWIHAAGGQAVIAHPARYRMTRSKLRQLLKQFVALQGDGLEVVSGSHSRDDYVNMAKHARDFDLLASAGSDFHCPENPWVELGRLPRLPEGCKPVWQNWNLSVQTELRSQLG
ncbi:MAG: phosphatase, partial [Candidatus Thiodiazotropha taylori]|nr:phosphatase [Candidatus Thiodiazotropha taylori]MCW4292414.1 phosphatase [Candidatus Thiodiazotropha taylori]